MTEVLKKLANKGFLRFHHGKFLPTSFKPMLQFDIFKIVNILKSVFSELSEYYSCAHN
jgi:hypothetical protein